MGIYHILRSKRIDTLLKFFNRNQVDEAVFEIDRNNIHNMRKSPSYEVNFDR